MSSVLQQPTTSKKASLRAVALLAASKLLSEKEEKDLRDMIPEGSEYSLELSLLATINGEDYSEDFDGKVTMGHGSNRAGQVDCAEWVAWILSHVPAEARKAIVLESLQVYSQNDCSFPVDKREYEEIKGTLSLMRTQNQQPVRGSLSVKLNKPRFTVVG